MTNGYAFPSVIGRVTIIDDDQGKNLLHDFIVKEVSDNYILTHF